MVAGVGNRAADTWDLAVTLPGQKRTRFEGLRHDGWGFLRPTWLGFMSNANSRTVFSVDNLELTNETV